jgi:hypothetical protein
METNRPILKIDGKIGKSCKIEKLFRFLYQKCQNIQYADTQHNGIHHNDTQHEKQWSLCRMSHFYCYADCHYAEIVIILSATAKYQQFLAL